MKQVTKKAELAKLTKLFANMPLNQKQLCEGLFDNAAYMIEKLGELQKQINEDGMTAVWNNGGGQGGLRKSPAVEIYNTMIKNYTAIIKQLNECMPPEDGVDALDEFCDG